MRKSRGESGNESTDVISTNDTPKLYISDLIVNIPTPNSGARYLPSPKLSARTLF